MPLFFFDTSDGEVDTADDVGLEFPDAFAARTEAVRVLPDMARFKIPNDDLRTYISRVRDESGRVIFEATMTFTAKWYVPPRK